MTGPVAGHNHTSSFSSVTVRPHHFEVLIYLSLIHTDNGLVPMLRVTRGTHAPGMSFLELIPNYTSAE